MEEEEEDNASPESVENRKQNLRKPLSGTLQISIRSARDIDHAPVPRGTRSVRESTVVIKVEDTPRARTHPAAPSDGRKISRSRSTMQRARSEVYDKLGSAHPVPVGMLWIRISDIVEEQRKKKFGQVPDARSTATDRAMAGSRRTASSPELVVAHTCLGRPRRHGWRRVQHGCWCARPQWSQRRRRSWFAVEPAGAIYLRLNFIKQNVRKRPYDARLGRQGAFRKRKEDVAEINGHKFVSRQFYRCFAAHSAASSCSTPPEASARTVGTLVTRSARKSGHQVHLQEQRRGDRDEVKINHRIPHRFEPITKPQRQLVLPLRFDPAARTQECS